MLKAILFLLVCLSIPFIHAQDFWDQKDSIKGPPRSGCVGFAISQQGHFVGGYDGVEFKRRAYAYDVFNDNWRDIASIGNDNGSGLNRSAACGFSLFDKGYVTTGQGENNGLFNDLWMYDPVLDAWTQKADYIGEARAFAVSFVINNYGYVGTGQSINGLKKDFFKYDPLNNVWINVADFIGSPRKSAVGFAMGGEGYVGTGDDGTLKKDFYQYRELTNSWVSIPDFPGTARSGATAWGIFPQGFVAMGEDLNQQFKNDVWEYNFYGNVWVQRANYPGEGRKYASNFVVNEVAYVGSGYNGEFKDDFYAYYRLLDVGQLTIEQDLQVFPIPSRGVVHVKSEFVNDKNQLEIFNLLGQNITNQFTILEGDHQLDIIPQFTASGKYYYTFTKNQNSTCQGSFIIL